MPDNPIFGRNITWVMQHLQVRIQGMYFSVLELYYCSTLSYYSADRSEIVYSSARHKQLHAFHFSFVKYTASLNTSSVEIAHCAVSGERFTAIYTIQ
jgi:hypothetical protein